MCFKKISFAIWVLFNPCLARCRCLKAGYALGGGPPARTESMLMPEQEETIGIQFLVNTYMHITYVN